MSKIVLFNEQARKSVKKGIDTVADAVKLTIGPRGRNVILDKSYGSPVITNDGVSIAKEISLKDRFENMGAEIAKEVATKTNDLAGDGTTTSLVLFQAIVNEGMKYTTLGVSAMDLKRGIEKASREVVSALKEISKPIKSKEELNHVATISAESVEIGKIIADTISEVGENGVVTVEESQSMGINRDIVQGLEFDKGYISPYMITSADRLEAVMIDPFVLITDKKISSIKEILPVLEKVAETGKKELVIIADDIDGDALTTFVVNKLRGTFSVLGIKAPGYGDKKKEYLDDIAITLGASVITSALDSSFEKVELGHLGKANRIVSTKDKTVIVGGKGKKTEIENYIKQLKNQKSEKISKYDLENLEKRIAKLAGGVAVIKVGASTETEMKYLKLKIEDAVNATKAAKEEGVVAGGGVALIKAGQKVLEKVSKNKEIMPRDIEIGFNLVLKAIEAPFKQIVKNADRDDFAVMIKEIRESKTISGYDAQKDKMVSDMIASGIIDPVKVTRLGVENSCASAGIFLTTEAAIAEESKEDKASGSDVAY